MIIDFEKMNEVTIPRLNNGEGSVAAKMFMDDGGKIMMSRLPKGSSIGLHKHNGSSEVNYVVSGCGKHLCDGVEESLTQGVCCYCPENSEHSIVNTGEDNLVLLTIVPQYK